MSKFSKSSVLVIFIISMAIMVAGCSSGFEPIKDGEITLTPPPAVSPVNAPTSDRVQSHDGGRVAIEVEWIEMENQTGNDSLTFYVAMNTHSVDLDGYNLGELAALRDNMGNEYRPVSWDSAPGGHHRKGTLTFSLPDSLSQGNAEYVEIVIRDIAGIEERVLKWEL